MTTYDNAFSFITAEKNNFTTVRVPLTTSKDWNMKEHIERCLAVSGGFFFSGKNDGNRPYDDLVTPIIDVAFRLEGFNVKDIVPYIDDLDENYKSFLIKKFHPQWAKKNLLDTFIDEVVESSIIFDLVIVKDVNGTRPEVIALQDIAFCDQTDALSGAFCIRHEYSVPELLKFKGKWNSKKIDQCILLSKEEKTVSTSNDQEVKTPSKYIECYELHGSFPETWIDDKGDPDNFIDQMHIVAFYTASDNTEQGITLFKGKSKSMNEKFKQLKIDVVRSKGRACGRSIVERLFESQVWNNYSAIKLKKMIDSAVNVLQTDSEEFGNKKITDLKENTILKHETGKPITKIDMGLQNFQVIQSFGIDYVNKARIMGSASEMALGIAPSSGTPFALQNLVVQQGEGIHSYRQGKIATFFSDVLYPWLILPALVKDMNGGKSFSEVLSLDEIEEVVDQIGTNACNDHIVQAVLNWQTVTPEQQTLLTEVIKTSFRKGNGRRFFEIIKSELSDIPIKISMNIAGKNKDLAKMADKLSGLIMMLLKTGLPLSAISKPMNELLEASGLSSIDFSKALNYAPSAPAPSTNAPTSPIMQSLPVNTPA